MLPTIFNNETITSDTSTNSSVYTSMKSQLIKITDAQDSTKELYGQVVCPFPVGKTSDTFSQILVFETNFVLSFDDNLQTKIQYSKVIYIPPESTFTLTFQLSSFSGNLMIFSENNLNFSGKLSVDSISDQIDNEGIFNSF